MDQYHIIGRKIDGVWCWYRRAITHEEFLRLLEQTGGNLPINFAVWHFDEEENIHTSKRVQALFKKPVIGEEYADHLNPIEEVLKYYQIEANQ